MKNFEAVLNQITIDMVLLPDRRLELLAAGVDPRDWPEPSPAKNAATAFLALTAAIGEDGARLKVLPQIERLEPGYPLPESTGELRAVYLEAITTGHAVKLGERIRGEPEKADEFIQAYQVRRSQEIGSVVINDSLSSWFDDQCKRIEEKKSLVLIPGWGRLSKMIGGFNPGRFSMLAAGTGVGKTLLALNLAHEAIRRFPVLFINMEMSVNDMVSRAVAAGTAMSHEQIATGELDFEKLTTYQERLRERSKLIVTDGKALTLDQIKAKVYITKQQHPELALVIVDYDQKIRLNISRGEQEWQKLKEAAEELEELAKSLDLHICMLAQANDDGDPKASERSKQPAATVLFFYRDGGDYVIEAVKNRFGKLGAKVYVKFDGAKSLIEEISYDKPRAGRLPL